MGHKKNRRQETLRLGNMVTSLASRTSDLEDEEQTLMTVFSELPVQRQSPDAIRRGSEMLSVHAVPVPWGEKSRTSSLLCSVTLLVNGHIPRCPTDLGLCPVL